MAPMLTSGRPPKRSASGAALALAAGTVAAASSLAGGCVIPDRSFVDSTDSETGSLSSDTPPASMPQLDAGAAQAACQEYCSAVMDTCVGTTQLYTDLAQCLALCAELPPGEPGDRAGNSVACRLALIKGPGFEANSCSDVGPMSRGQCGSSCQAFCALRLAACSADARTAFESGYCEAGCEELRNVGQYSVSMDSDNVPDYDGADTLQCRLGHLVAALADPARALDECAASSIVPRNQISPCQDGIDLALATDLDTYCGLVQYACKDDQAVYTSVEECKRVSLTFERGDPEDIAANTLRCRRYHAYNAFEDPGLHCTHAGPTGDGTCAAPEETKQGNCTSYCRILERSCPRAYESLSEGQSADDLASCVEECLLLPDSDVGGFRTEPRYAVGVALPAGTLKCRTLHAVLGLEAPNGPECDAAVGARGSACAAPEEIADPQ